MDLPTTSTKSEHSSSRHHKESHHRSKPTDDSGLPAPVQHYHYHTLPLSYPPRKPCLHMIFTDDFDDEFFYTEKEKEELGLPPQDVNTLMSSWKPMRMQGCPCAHSPTTPGTGFSLTDSVAFSTNASVGSTSFIGTPTSSARQMPPETSPDIVMPLLDD
eukprot:TRINITY_DN28886_c0_g1_i1.p1 TRINITY_DN28886_c0_g1~~TRINITY_DN28886_c0_g1_i1.p1  ORF type:complete len:159 (+),score=13.47 TRINITY_DN28886_c0_g1_i1:101-577(+)